MTDHTLETHGYGFSEDGEPVRVESFPYDEIDARLDGAEEQPAHGDAGAAVREVMWWILSPQRGEIRRDSEGAWVRVLAMAWVWRHPYTNAFESVSEMAVKHKMSERQLHRSVRKYADLHGISPELVRKRSGRDALRGRTYGHRQDEPAADRRGA